MKKILSLALAAAVLALGGVGCEKKDAASSNLPSETKGDWTVSGGDSKGGGTAHTAKNTKTGVSITYETSPDGRVRQVTVQDTENLGTIKRTAPEPTPAVPPVVPSAPKPAPPPGVDPATAKPAG